MVLIHHYWWYGCKVGIAGKYRGVYWKQKFTGFPEQYPNIYRLQKIEMRKDILCFRKYLIS